MGEGQRRSCALSSPSGSPAAGICLSSSASIDSIVENAIDLSFHRRIIILLLSPGSHGAGSRAIVVRRAPPFRGLPSRQSSGPYGEPPACGAGPDPPNTQTPFEKPWLRNSSGSPDRYEPRRSRG